MAYEKKKRDFCVKEILLTPKETADYLGMNEGTLAIWRYREKHGLPGNPDSVPQYIHVGRHVRYPIKDIKSYVKKRSKNGND